MEKHTIASVLTLRMAGDFNCTDNSDLMRLNMLAMDLSNSNHTVASIKETIGFRTANSDFNLPDEYLQELINQVDELTTPSIRG